MKKAYQLLTAAMFTMGSYGVALAGDSYVEVECGEPDVEFCYDDYLWEVGIKCDGDWEGAVRADFDGYEFELYAENDGACITHGYIASNKIETKCEDESGDEVEAEIKFKGEYTCENGD